jgi:hypothetical protein
VENTVRYSRQDARQAGRTREFFRGNLNQRFFIDSFPFWLPGCLL